MTQARQDVYLTSPRYFYRKTETREIFVVCWRRDEYEYYSARGDIYTPVSEQQYHRKTREWAKRRTK